MALGKEHWLGPAARCSEGLGVARSIRDDFRLYSAQSHRLDIVIGTIKAGRVRYQRYHPGQVTRAKLYKLGLSERL